MASSFSFEIDFKFWQFLIVGKICDHVMWYSVFNLFFHRVCVNDPFRMNRLDPKCVYVIIQL